MNSVMGLVRALYPFGYSVVSEGSDLAIEQFRNFFGSKGARIPLGCQCKELGVKEHQHP